MNSKKAARPRPCSAGFSGVAGALFAAVCLSFAAPVMAQSPENEPAAGLSAEIDALGRSLSDIFGPDGLAQQPADLPEESATPVIAAPRDGSTNTFLSGGRDPMPAYSGFKGVSGLSVVVELFTSQGCSNCPPADAMIAALGSQPDVLPLSFHVDYWDYLGWADSFAQTQFTERQQRYAYAAGERAVYTPQVIVDGQDTALSLRPAELMAMVDAHRASPATVSVTTEKEAGRSVVELQPLSDLGGPLAVLIVHYLPERQIEVKAGENRGRTMTYRNVVAGLDRLADWDGLQPIRLNFDEKDHVVTENLPDDVRHAILIQKIDGLHGLPGPIIGALRLD